jgi:PAS domain S-box-containing protein
MRPVSIWLGAPLAIRGHTLGVIVVQDYENPDAYGEEDKRILTFVGGQIALAIERKRADDALRESEQKFRAFFEASSTGVMIHDEEKYLDVNPAIVEMFGYDRPEDMIGLNPARTSPPLQPGGISSAELSRRYITECLTKGNARFDWVGQHRDGRELQVEVILTRIEMGGRRVMQAIVNDISDRKRAEEELLRALAREKELSQLKTNFVSMVSHEFRTPLGIILSSAEILDEYLEQLSPEERKEQLQSIQKNSRRMASLMEEALLLGRFEAGKMDFKPAPMDLRLFSQRLLDEVLSATEHLCPIQIIGEPCARPAFADDRLLRHIFINLLTNAVKYSAPGTPVEFHLAAEGVNAVCLIRDRGIGIPESDREWLFEAFHRGRNVGERAGTGLGLTIVKRCVELHGGKIKIESRVGEGTTVTVALPLFPASAGGEV